MGLVNEPPSCVKVDGSIKLQTSCATKHTSNSMNDVERSQGSTQSVAETAGACVESRREENTLATDSIISGSQCCSDNAVKLQRAVKTEPVKDEHVKMEYSSLLNTSVDNSSTCSDKNLMTPSISSGIDNKLFLQKPPPLIKLGDIIGESFDQHAHSSCNGSTFRSISSILSTPDSGLRQTDMAAIMATSFGNVQPDTLVSSTPISLASYVEPGTWFSVLPRRSCDLTMKKSGAGGATSTVCTYSTKCHTSLFTPLEQHMRPSDLTTFQSRQSSTPQQSEDTSSMFNSMHSMTASSFVNCSVLQCVTSDTLQIAASVEAMLVRDQLQYNEAKAIPESRQQFFSLSSLNSNLLN